MKQVFLDPSQQVVIKVFENSRQLEREFCGVRAFSRVCLTPEIEKLDLKVARISLLDGFLGYQIIEGDLNKLVADHLIKTAKLDMIACSCSIFETISNLEVDFLDNPQILMRLKKIKKAILNIDLMPVHGDLQKQNIIIREGKIGLIDFEHFLFAPKELEIVNSLYFNDGNCLDITAISKILPQGFFDQKILKLMMEFYAIKQLSLKNQLLNQKINYKIEESL